MDDRLLNTETVTETQYAVYEGEWLIDGPFRHDGAAQAVIETSSIPGLRIVTRTVTYTGWTDHPVSDQTTIRVIDLPTPDHCTRPPVLLRVDDIQIGDLLVADGHWHAPTPRLLGYITEARTDILFYRDDSGVERQKSLAWNRGEVAVMRCTCGQHGHPLPCGCLRAPYRPDQDPYTQYLSECDYHQRTNATVQPEETPA